MTLALSTIGLNGTGSGTGDVGAVWAFTAAAGSKKTRSRRPLVAHANESFFKRKRNGEFSSVLTLYQAMQYIEEGDSSKNDNRHRRVSFFFIVHFRDQIARRHVKRHAGGER